MPELSQGKQFLYRLIVSQLHQDGFSNVATSLSIATIGKTKVVPSDRLNNLITLCAQVVRDTDAESTFHDIDITNGKNSNQASNAENPEMGTQHSAFYPSLTHLIQDNRQVQNSDIKIELENKSDKNDGIAQMLKVFTSMSEATRQAYLQSQALQKKPLFLKNTSSCQPIPDTLRPFPLSTPDIKTPQCRSTLLPFSSTNDSILNVIDVNGQKQEPSVHQQHVSIDAVEQIIRQVKDGMDDVVSSSCAPTSASSDPGSGTVTADSVTAAPTIPPTTLSSVPGLRDTNNKVVMTTTTTTQPTTIPINFLHDSVTTDSVIQELLMQRQLKQRRFKDLECSFVSHLIKPEQASKQGSLLPQLSPVVPAPTPSPPSDFTALLSRLSGADISKHHSANNPVSKLSDGGSSTLGAGGGHILAPGDGSQQQSRYECPRCGRVFAYEYVLQTHMRQVCPDRSNYKHPCTVCNKRFQNQSSLKRHMIVHTGERKYECEVCHKRFGRSHHLKRHVKIHEMEAANYNQHQFPPGGLGAVNGIGAPVPGAAPGVSEETLQLLLQLGALNKFTMASLIDGTFVEPDGASNDNESVDDGDSQGDIDMDDHGSDVGEPHQNTITKANNSDSPKDGSPLQNEDSIVQNTTKIVVSPFKASATETAVQSLLNNITTVSPELKKTEGTSVDSLSSHDIMTAILQGPK